MEGFFFKRSRLFLDDVKSPVGGELSQLGTCVLIKQELELTKVELGEWFFEIPASARSNYAWFNSCCYHLPTGVLLAQL